ncbi:MAG TPA: type II toxin-antitoxin system prevent-host-death family antitoxin, partial [Planctomycetota bacterium]|nr:type II toxin-antitoxin system prevent-host-death family antitoxin [Planctomycetota bacterium]
PIVAPMRLSYSIYEAKAKLSEILRVVRKGRRITITDRGREVARIVPIGEDENLEQRLGDLVAAGILSPPTNVALPGPEAGESRPGALERFLRDRD